MRAQRCDGRWQDSDKFSARNKRHCELNSYRLNQRPRRRKIIGSKYLGNECARRTVVGWQDPIAFNDILESNSALSRQFTLRPHNEDKRLIEQDFGMEVVLLSRGPRNQQ